MRRAGFWRRTGAMGVDLLIVSVVNSIVLVLLIGRGGEATEREELLAFGIWSTIWLAYFLPEALIGRSIGKMLLRLVIARADGARADRWTLLLRYTTKHFGFLLWLVFAITAQPLFYWLAGVMNLIIVFGCLRALGEDHVAWHDIWCHTSVFGRERANVAVPPANPNEPVGAPPPT